jgi:hypothetical protein
MKLVMRADRAEKKCKTCEKIDTKWGRRHKEVERIKRWRHEKGRSASIEASEKIISGLDQEIADLEIERQLKQQTLN